jgi:hypothetical protein
VPTILLLVVLALTQSCADEPLGQSEDPIGCDVVPGTSDPGACQVSCGASQVRDPVSGRCKDVCSIDVETEQRAPGEKTLDCGNLPLTASPTEREAGQACVLGAVTSGRPFKLITWMMGIDSRIAYAYLAPGAGNQMSKLSFDSNFSSFSSYGGGAISKQTCTTFRATPDCQVSNTTTCLTCVDESEHSKVCEVPKPKDSAASDRDPRPMSLEAGPGRGDGGPPAALPVPASSMSLDAGLEPSDGGSPTALPSAVCTPGADQTCNDDLTISSLHGRCNPDSTCTCGQSFAKSSSTGKCQ